MTTNKSELPTRGRSVRVPGAEDPGWPQLTVRTSHHPWRTVGLIVGISLASLILSAGLAPAAAEGDLRAEVGLQYRVDGER